jgi:hypothetical protein
MLLGHNLLWGEIFLKIKVRETLRRSHNNLNTTDSAGQTGSYSTSPELTMYVHKFKFFAFEIFYFKTFIIIILATWVKTTCNKSANEVGLLQYVLRMPHILSYCFATLVRSGFTKKDLVSIPCEF